MAIAVAGGFGVGLSMFTERIPEPGETLAGASLMIAEGGKGSNQAVTAARLGVRAALFTGIGDDQFAAMARDLWKREGVDDSAVVASSGATMSGLIIIESGGENRILLADGVLADLKAPDLAGFEAALRSSHILLVSTEIAADVASEALRQGRQAGLTTVLNPAPVIELSADDWRNIDYLTPNEHEAAQLLGVHDEALLMDVSQHEKLSKRAAMLAERTGTTVVMTAGSLGAFIAPADGDAARPVEHVAAEPVAEVVDTTGAGDCFNGAFAAALDQGRPLIQAVRFACRCAARAVQKRGVIPALPYLADVEPER